MKKGKKGREQILIGRNIRKEWKKKTNRHTDLSAKNKRKVSKIRNFIFNDNKIINTHTQGTNITFSSQSPL